MMNLGGWHFQRLRNTLGLAIEPRAIQIAESETGRTARFELPADMNWDEPWRLGDALRRFLSAQKFSARRAVVGLPGRWILTRPQQLPPIEWAQAVNVLHLTMEREFPSDARQWTFDVFGWTSKAAPSTVLLAATPSDRLSRIEAVMSSAGLQLLAVTATTLSVAMLSAEGFPVGVLHLTDDGVEFATARAGNVSMIERLSCGSGGSGLDASTIAAEIRRVGAIATMRSGSGSERVSVVDDRSGGQPIEAARLSDLLGMPVSMSEAEMHGPAVLALLGSGQASTLPVNFLASRLAPTVPRRWTTRRTATAAVIAALVIGLGWLVLDWRSQQSAVDDLEENLASMRAPLALAKANVERVKLAEGWFDDRPAMLECLRAVTLAFPETGPVRATSLALREDLTGTLAGKAPDEESALAMVDRMKSSKDFGEVKTLYLRREDGKSKSVSFALTFAFIAEK